MSSIDNTLCSLRAVAVHEGKTIYELGAFEFANCSSTLEQQYEYAVRFDFLTKPDNLADDDVSNYDFVGEVWYDTRIGHHGYVQYSRRFVPPDWKKPTYDEFQSWVAASEQK